MSKKEHDRVVIQKAFLKKENVQKKVTQFGESVSNFGEIILIIFADRKENRKITIKKSRDSGDLSFRGCSYLDMEEML